MISRLTGIRDREGLARCIAYMFVAKRYTDRQSRATRSEAEWLVPDFRDHRKVLNWIRKIAPRLLRNVKEPTHKNSRRQNDH